MINGNSINKREALGYLYGSIKGDGHIRDNGKIIFFNTSKRMAERFLKCLKICEKSGLFKRKQKRYETSEIPIKEIKPRGKNKKIGFRVTYCSVDSIEKIKMFSPFKEKNKVKKEVIRGLFDSEGYIRWDEDRCWRGLIFSNTDESIIDLYCSLLDCFGIDYCKSYNNSNSEFSVTSGSWDSFFFFDEEIGFTLEKHKKVMNRLKKYYKEKGWKMKKMDRNKIKRLVEDGLTDEEISEKLGFHKKSIGRARRELDLKPNFPEGCSNQYS